MFFPPENTSIYVALFKNCNKKEPKSNIVEADIKKVEYGKYFSMFRNCPVIYLTF